MEEMPHFATFGGGCFWCLEAAFAQVYGVDSIVSGYCGGNVERPSYTAVCTGRTGHAEVVRLTFNPAQRTYRDLLEIFFAIHDPTTLNRQGNDAGTQYRSVIFFHTPEQEQQARSYMAHLEAQHIWFGKIVTEVVPAQPFYPAEDYHQEYFRRNPEQGYCQVVINPKIGKLRRSFSDYLKANQ